MPHHAARYQWVSRLSRWAMLGTMALLAVTMAVTIAFTVDVLLNWARWSETLTTPWILPAGCVLAFFGEAALGVWLVTLFGTIKLAVSVEDSLRTSTDRFRSIETLLEVQGNAINKLVDLNTLSDQAKSLLYRNRELEALREAVQEDVMRQDYASAEGLIDSMESRLGFAAEAKRLRQDVQASKQITLDEKIDDALSRLEDIIARHDWPRAMREAQRLGELFKGHAKTTNLKQRIEKAMAHHKRALLQEYGEAVRKDDVDHSIELLKELDKYLTPQEAAALSESARGVFRAKLHNLGVQFAITVTDKQWSQAVDVGEEIMKEFPNTRMAQEVREKMDLLKTRAAEEPASFSQ